jgi:hypothetical protein
MAFITLRSKFGESSATDLKLSVQDRTFDHLRVTISPEVRVSAFFDEDVANVAAEYAEVFVEEESAFESHVTKVIPGSRTRKDIVLPGAMKQGEQLTILVERRRK